MKTIAILEGWAGGPRLSRDFAKRAKQHNLALTRKVSEADYIVAHSTGCYMLPDILKAERIMLINPPFWPGESIVKCWIRMNKAELSFLRKSQGNLRFLKDKLWETFYIFAKPGYTWSVLKNQSHLDFAEKLEGKTVILVRNSDDEFCSPQIKSALKDYENISYSEVPGYHGNYYLNPQPYIDLLLKELK